LKCFYSDSGKYYNTVPTREFIRTTTSDRLEKEAIIVAYAITMPRQGEKRNKKLVLFLSEKIHHFFLSYQKEYCLTKNYCSQMRDCANDIL
jgi:hypothetical protein